MTITDHAEDVRWAQQKPRTELQISVWSGLASRFYGLNCLQPTSVTFPLEGISSEEKAGARRSHIVVHEVSEESEE